MISKDALQTPRSFLCNIGESEMHMKIYAQDTPELQILLYFLARDSDLCSLPAVTIYPAPT